VRIAWRPTDSQTNGRGACLSEILHCPVLRRQRPGAEAVGVEGSGRYQQTAAKKLRAYAQRQGETGRDRERQGHGNIRYRV
jgi:hypothetical protein